MYSTLHGCAPKWREIGVFLGLEISELDIIKSDEEGVHSRLERMLLLWIRRVDPLPTKYGIIEVLRKLNLPKEAEKLEKGLT